MGRNAEGPKGGRRTVNDARHNVAAPFGRPAARSEMHGHGPLAFLDSGIGGLPYLSLTRYYLPNLHYIYVADSARFPYGNRSAAEIRRAVCDVVGRLVARHAITAVVVACNTASVVALQTLRNEFSIPFVGVVPAIKPAARTSRKGRVGVLATSRTVGAAYLESLIETHARDCIVVRASGSELVQFVEELTPDVPKAERLRAVEGAVRPLLGESVDTLVLGCTHFTHLADEFREVLGPDVAVIDSRAGVARQVVRVVEERSLVARGEEGRPVQGLPSREGGRSGLETTSQGGESGSGVSDPSAAGGGALVGGEPPPGAMMYVTGSASVPAAAVYRQHGERFDVAFMGALPGDTERSPTELSPTERSLTERSIE